MFLDSIGRSDLPPVSIPSEEVKEYEEERLPIEPPFYSGDYPPVVARKVEPLSCCCCDFIKDPEWMSVAVNLFAITSLVCLLMGNNAAHYVPYLSVISAPLYLYYISKDAAKRFGLVNAAVKTGSVADAFFWGGKGIGSIGDAFSDIIKALGGSLTLFGLTQFPALQLEIPILLIVLSTIGGVSQSGQVGRIASILNRFKEEKGKIQKDSLKSLKQFIMTLKELNLDQTALEASQLNRENFKRFRFTSELREEILKQEVESLMPLLTDEQQSELNKLSDQLYEKCLAVVELAESEIERKLAQQLLTVVCSVVTLIAGILFIACPEYATAGYILSLVAAGLGVFCILCNKGISQKQFVRLRGCL